MRQLFCGCNNYSNDRACKLLARSDDIPTLDVHPVCRGIASQSTLEVGLQGTNFDQCLQSEEEVRDQLKQAWPTFSAEDKRHCVALAKTGGESSYTKLVTCLEMARDVRALRSTEAASSSRAGTGQASSLPSAVRPAPANSPASRSSSAKEPANSDVDSTLKELQRLTADAQNARASEALTQRKLADTEADLKRAKDEAGRTSKEAEQARADTKAAR